MGLFQPVGGNGHGELKNKFNNSMKKFSVKDLEYIPAGHEDVNNPGVLKKVMFTVNDVKIEGTIQMVNWSKMAIGIKFSRHYHEYMDEVFIIISGKAEIEVGEEKAILEATDAIYLPQRVEHEMENVGTEDLYYIAMGIVTAPGGKTVVVDKK